MSCLPHQGTETGLGMPEGHGGLVWEVWWLVHDTRELMTPMYLLGTKQGWMLYVCDLISDGQ